MSANSELVLDLNAAETTILLSEQNLKFALAVSDRVVVLDKGHVVYTGAVQAFQKEDRSTRSTWRSEPVPHPASSPRKDIYHDATIYFQTTPRIVMGPGVYRRSKAKPTLGGNNG